MADTHDHGRGPNYDQRGQHVHGPQYNADRINISESVSPDVIAEGIRRSRQSHRPAPPRGISTADIEREREERDLKSYGYRYYTRDRRRWLATLAPQERWDEERRESKRVQSLTAHRHHRRILRSGGLPPDTSPADPRYVVAKRALERHQARRGRNGTIALIAFFAVFILIAILDGADWFAALMGLPLLVGGIALVVGAMRGSKGGGRRSSP